MKQQFPNVTVIGSSQNKSITVKTQFIISVGGSEKEWWIPEIINAGALYKTGFVQGPWKLNKWIWENIWEQFI
jgi:hypothetical protein